MPEASGEPVFGNAAQASSATRGWFMGHFMPESAGALRTSDVEVKWFTHKKGDTRSAWADGSPVRTLNMLIRGKFALLFPQRRVVLEKEGDFVLFGPCVAHSYETLEESLVLTVRWPSVSV